MVGPVGARKTDVPSTGLDPAAPRPAASEPTADGASVGRPPADSFRRVADPVSSQLPATPDSAALRAAVAESSMVLLPVDARGLTRSQQEAAHEAFRQGKLLVPMLLPGTDPAVLLLELRQYIGLSADSASSAGISEALRDAADRLDPGALDRPLIVRFSGDPLATPTAPRPADVFLS